MRLHTLHLHFIVVRITVTAIDITVTAIDNKILFSYIKKKEATGGGQNFNLKTSSHFSPFKSAQDWSSSHSLLHLRSPTRPGPSHPFSQLTHPPASLQGDGDPWATLLLHGACGRWESNIRTSVPLRQKKKSCPQLPGQESFWFTLFLKTIQMVYPLPKCPILTKALSS